MNQFETQPAQTDASEGLFPGFPTLDVAKLVRLILKRLWIAVSVFGLFVLLAIVYLFTAEKIYESNALIYIESDETGGTFGDFKGAPKASFKSLDALKSIASSMSSGNVILRVVDSLDLRNDASFFESKNGSPTDAEIVEFMGKRVSSELIRGERSIYLSVRDTDPERASLIASTIIAEFRKMLQEQNAQQADLLRTTLENECEAQSGRVDQVEIELLSFREKYPELALDEKDGFLNRKLIDLQTKANAASDEAIRLKADYEQYLRVKDDPAQILEIGSYAGVDSIQKLLLARDQKSAEFYKIKEQFTPNHQTYRAYQSEVNGLNEQLKTTAIALGEKIKNQYEAAEARAKIAAQAVLLQKEENLKTENIRRQFRSLVRRRDAAMTTYDSLLARLNENSVIRNADETMIRTFNPPLVNEKPVSPKKAVSLVLAGMLGGMLGLGIVLVLGLLDRTLSSKKQVEATLGLSVLSEIPLANGQQNWNLKESIMVSKDPNSLVSESFRALRTSLSSMTPRSVMFTSAVGQEGKSFCAANLAVLQAQFGYRTLLVDADFRNPQMASLFTASTAMNDKGTGLVTQNRCQETVVPNLFLVSLGRFTTDGGEPMNGEHFAAMLWEAYSNFDCVIIDTSPLCVVSDGLNYSRYADSVVLVVRANQSDAGDAKDAIQELRRMRAPLAGCVLNGIEKVDSVKEDYVIRTNQNRQEPAFANT